jgi:hypothetical protein
MSYEMEAQIRKAEEIVGGMTLSEALYGGPRGPGMNSLISKLTDNVTTLSTSVNDLSKSVSKVSDDVNGGDGVRVLIRDMKREMTELRSKAEKAESVIWKIVWALSGIGLGTLIVVGRVGYNIWEGVTPK